MSESTDPVACFDVQKEGNLPSCASMSTCAPPNDDSLYSSEAIPSRKSSDDDISADVVVMLDPARASEATPSLDRPTSARLWRVRCRLPNLRRGFITPDPMVEPTSGQVTKLRRFPPSLCRGFQTPDPISSIPEDYECADQVHPRQESAKELHIKVSNALLALEAGKDEEDPLSPLMPKTMSAATSSGEWKQPGSVLIIVDWDDTLFPTSWLWNQPWRDSFLAGSTDQIPHQDLQLLADFDHAARAFLLSASCLGQITCITLSKQNWVNTCLKLLPHLAQAWKDLKIEVFYARELRWKDKRPVGFGKFAQERSIEEQKELGTWLKKKAMKFVLGQFYQTCSWKNVVSIGDGCHEKWAMQDIRFSRVNPPSKRSACPKNFRAKTVLMTEDPDCSYLMSELHTLQSCLPQLVSLDSDCDIDMSSDDLFETHLSIVDTADA
mmetsp:Transcript_112659/g.217008  ORF Transcript_112659/g.217008 Transcript_112659/m.217008 type:complete len:438 (-) Transcript_112659:107-1420(-)